MRRVDFNRAYDYLLENSDTDIFPAIAIDDEITFEQAVAIEKDIALLSAEQWREKYTPQIFHATTYKKNGTLRNATQIDSTLNLCYLALAVEAARKCERKRMSRDVVFSYRFDFSGVQLFWNTGYSDYVETINLHKVGDRYTTIITLDLKDFYASISPRLLSESLAIMGLRAGLISRISKIIEIVGAVGLPVGGDASRILSELVISRLDSFLDNKAVKFARFVDDITLFLTSSQDAEIILNEIRNFLQPLGLSLNDSKVKVERDGFWQTQKYPAHNYRNEGSLIRELNRTCYGLNGYAIKFTKKPSEEYVARLFAPILRFMPIQFVGIARWIIYHRDQLSPTTLELVSEEAHKIFEYPTNVPNCSANRAYLVLLMKLSLNEQRKEFLDSIYEDSDEIVKYNIKRGYFYADMPQFSIDDVDICRY